MQTIILRYNATFLKNLRNFMFLNLSSRLTQIIRDLTGRGQLTKENIQATLNQVRIALLEADVALKVVDQFITDLEQKAVGQKILDNTSASDILIKLVYDELVKTLGEDSVSLNLQTQPPAIIMVVGLQGSGKTTTIAKLASWLKKTEQKKILLASTDIYRPAAIEQLKILAEQIEIPFYEDNSKDPITIAKNTIQTAKNQLADVIILDTAGRLHIDQEMMDELQNLEKTVNPIETLLVIDSMLGQDAANIAKNFNEKLSLTGIILTKTDGDARGGAALSMRIITGQPIKFIGTGEKIDALELFHPDRIASRILDMGDVVTLVEEVQQKIDHKKAEKLAKKIEKGLDFDLEDFREQLQQMRNMGGISSLLSKLPGLGQLPTMTKNMVNDDLFMKMEAILNSMTKRERRFPTLIRGSHKRRISLGSGTKIQDVNQLMKKFEQMQKMMKHLNGGKLTNMMKNMLGDI